MSTLCRSEPPPERPARLVNSIPTQTEGLHVKVRRRDNVEENGKMPQINPETPGGLPSYTNTGAPGKVRIESSDYRPAIADRTQLLHLIRQIT
jgi:hypothetical protein